MLRRIVRIGLYLLAGFGSLIVLIIVLALIFGDDVGDDGSQPEDKYNHGVKAVIYGLINRYGYGYISENSTIKVKRW